MEFVNNDGGRSKYFDAKSVGDCGTRAIANGTGLDYKLIYDAINKAAKRERPAGKTGRRGRSTARNGVWAQTEKRVLEDVIGWVWTPTMLPGTGVKVHLTESELPKCRLILRLSHHYSCCENGKLYDTWDCAHKRAIYGLSEEDIAAGKDENTEDTAVYGYWRAPEGWDKEAAESKLRAYLAGTPTVASAPVKENTRVADKASAAASIREKYEKAIRKCYTQITRLRTERERELRAAR